MTRFCQCGSECWDRWCNAFHGQNSNCRYHKLTSVITELRYRQRTGCGCVSGMADRTCLSFAHTSAERADRRRHTVFSCIRPWWDASHLAVPEASAPRLAPQNGGCENYDCWARRGYIGVWGRITSVAEQTIIAQPNLPSPKMRIAKLPSRHSVGRSTWPIFVRIVTFRLKSRQPTFQVSFLRLFCKFHRCIW